MKEGDREDGRRMEWTGERGGGKGGDKKNEGITINYDYNTK